jgi:hypothetical protein
VISIKRLLDADRPAEVFARVAQRLLLGLNTHAVEGDPEDLEHFRLEVNEVWRDFDLNESEEDLMVRTGCLLKAMQEYTRRTTNFHRARRSELQAIVKMLADTVSEMSEPDRPAWNVCARSKGRLFPLPRRRMSASSKIAWVNV